MDRLTSVRVWQVVTRLSLAWHELPFFQHLKNTNRLGEFFQDCVQSIQSASSAELIDKWLDYACEIHDLVSQGLLPDTELALSQQIGLFAAELKEKYKNPRRVEPDGEIVIYEELGRLVLIYEGAASDLMLILIPPGVTMPTDTHLSPI